MLSQEEKEYLKSEANRIDGEDYNRCRAIEINVGKKMKYEPRRLVTILRRLAEE